jgi:hypothetical protein
MPASDIDPSVRQAGDERSAGPPAAAAATASLSACVSSPDGSAARTSDVGSSDERSTSRRDPFRRGADERVVSAKAGVCLVARRLATARLDLAAPGLSDSFRERHRIGIIVPSGDITVLNGIACPLSAAAPTVSPSSCARSTPNKPCLKHLIPGFALDAFRGRVAAAAEACRPSSANFQESEPPSALRRGNPVPAVNTSDRDASCRCGIELIGLGACVEEASMHRFGSSLQCGSLRFAAAIDPATPSAQARRAAGFERVVQ